MKKLGLVTLFCFIFILAACGGADGGNVNESTESNQNEVEAPPAQKVEAFEAINQDGEPFTLEDLSGKYWVADFIFTNCTTVCLPMTSNMKTLQDGLKEAGLEDVQLVSFSVDPDYDTPEVLTEYGNDYGADFSNWHFLTGYEFDYISNYARDSFKTLVVAPPEGEDQVTHGTQFFLVNPEGEIVSHYSGTETSAMDQIIEDLKNEL